MACARKVIEELTPRARTERLWKEYFRDPSQWWDNRNTKVSGCCCFFSSLFTKKAEPGLPCVVLQKNPRAPDFRHKLTNDSLWMDGLCNASWAKHVLTLEKGDEPCAMKAHPKDSNSGDWKMLGLEEALPSLEQGIPPLPSVEDFACLLHKCRVKSHLGHALRLHALMRKHGLEPHPFLGNQLVLMLVEVGSMSHAQQVFDGLLHRNECSWNSLIIGYITWGESQRAFTLYQKMQEHDSLHPSGYTFLALLKSCAKMKDLERGSQIHAALFRTGLLERDVLIGSSLVDMYAKCGSLAKAQEVFDKLPIRDVVSWTALMAGYAEHGCCEQALKCFQQMQYKGICPDAVTFVCSLKACGSIGATEKGQGIHAEIVKIGLERELFIGNTLVDMYAKSGFLAEAQEVFDKLPVRTIVSWNALITGYVEHGHGQEALRSFEQMQHEGMSPDDVTLVCCLKACGRIGAIERGQEVHVEISRKGLEGGLLIGNTLIDMYGKCGSLAKAQEVFDKLPVRDVVSWNALIVGYAEYGDDAKALDCFKLMQSEGISPDDVTFVCSLKACGSVVATGKGQKMHADIVRKGLERDPFVGNTLVDMYAKCGLLAETREVFDKLSVRTIVSWNALITGYAQLGESENVCNIFDRMIGEGIQPNHITFMTVLNACSHAGLLYRGQIYFEAMSKDFGIIPTLEHHTCMVDLLGRAGHVDVAVAMIKKMPHLPGIAVWHTVLGACQKWGNAELGRQAFEHAVRLDEKDVAAYVSMSNIYAD